MARRAQAPRLPLRPRSASDGRGGTHEPALPQDPRAARFLEGSDEGAARRRGACGRRQRSGDRRPCDPERVSRRRSSADGAGRLVSPAGRARRARRDRAAPSRDARRPHAPRAWPAARGVPGRHRRPVPVHHRRRARRDRDRDEHARADGPAAPPPRERRGEGRPACAHPGADDPPPRAPEGVRPSSPCLLRRRAPWQDGRARASGSAVSHGPGAPYPGERAWLPCRGGTGRK